MPDESPIILDSIAFRDTHRAAFESFMLARGEPLGLITDGVLRAFLATLGLEFLGWCPDRDAFTVRPCR
jgi:hypothetical protein